MTELLKARNIKALNNLWLLSSAFTTWLQEKEWPRNISPKRGKKTDDLSLNSSLKQTWFKMNVSAKNSTKRNPGLQKSTMVGQAYWFMIFRLLPPPNGRQYWTKILFKMIVEVNHFRRFGHTQGIWDSNTCMCNLKVTSILYSHQNQEWQAMFTRREGWALAKKGEGGKRYFFVIREWPNFYLVKCETAFFFSWIVILLDMLEDSDFRKHDNSPWNGKEVFILIWTVILVVSSNILDSN